MRLWRKLRRLLTPRAFLEWQAWWDARLAALEASFGPSFDQVWHATPPFDRGGPADVVAFCNHVPGWAFVTCDLVGDSGQPESSLGAYELMICTRQREEWAPHFISGLARYTLEAALEPGHTMDIGNVLAEDTTLNALLFAEPDIPINRFSARGRRFGVLLCLGITRSEFDYRWSHGHEALLDLLRRHSVFPYTDLRRPPVI